MTQSQNFHIRCAILHRHPPCAHAPLFLSVKTPRHHPHDVLGQRHVARRLAHLMWKKEGIGAPNVEIAAHLLWVKTTL